jgi:hypothetical protein
VSKSALTSAIECAPLQRCRWDPDSRPGELGTCPRANRHDARQPHPAEADLEHRLRAVLFAHRARSTEPRAQRCARGPGRSLQAVVTARGRIPRWQIRV